MERVLCAPCEVTLDSRSLALVLTVWPRKLGPTCFLWQMFLEVQESKANLLVLLEVYLSVKILQEGAVSVQYTCGSEHNTMGLR